MGLPALCAMVNVQLPAVVRERSPTLVPSKTTYPPSGGRSVRASAGDVREAYAGVLPRQHHRIQSSYLQAGGDPEYCVHRGHRHHVRNYDGCRGRGYSQHL